MKLKLTPSFIFGEIKVPSSKSFAHRALIAAYLSGETTEILGNFNVGDIDTTIDCLKALGAKILQIKNGLIITAQKLIDGAMLNVKDSGSTLRFLLSVCTALGANASFIGTERLNNRPIGELLNTLRSGGASFSAEKMPFKALGKLCEGEYKIVGNVSSQYISGLLLAAPIICGNKSIIVENNIVSEDYINITLKVLKSFGVNVELKQNGYYIDERQKYASPKKIEVEGDFSSACFFAVMAALTGSIKIFGLNKQSVQGDKIIIDILKRVGAEVKFSSGALVVTKKNLNAIEFDAENYPDTVPCVAVLLANCKGESVIKNVSRLKNKESDRVAEVIRLLNSFGGEAYYKNDNIYIKGGSLKGCNFVCPDDHRIAMSAAIAAMKAEGETILENTACVKKSYPQFFEELKKVGGKVNV